MKKRLLALMLSSLMLVTLLAACGGGSSDETTGGTQPQAGDKTEDDATEPGDDQTEDPSEEPSAPEELTIKVFFPAGEMPTNPDTHPTLNILKDELGVTFESEYLVGDLDERIGIMIAGGDYPDIMPFNQRVVDNGGAHALDDLIAERSNLANHYERFINRMKSPHDGQIYYMPNYGVIYGDEVITEHWGTGVFIQKAVLAEYDYPLITTLDEYFDIIERYANDYPEIDGAPTIGYTILNDGWRNFGLVNPPQFLAGYPNNGNAIVDPDTLVAYDPSTTDIAKQYYQKLNEINAKGLFDKEAAAMNYDQYIAKLSAGNVLGTMDQKWNMNSANTALVGADKDERTYVSIPIVYDDSIQEYYRDQTVINLNNGFMVTTIDDEKIAPIMDFFNEITTEEWTTLFSWGIEGESYMVDDSGKFYRTEEQREEQRDAGWSPATKFQAFFDYAPKIEGTFSDGNVSGPGNDPDEYYAALSEFDKSFLDGYGFKTYAEFYALPPENPVYYPTWQVNIPDQTPEAIANTKASDIKVQMLPGVITASPENFEAEWNNFVDEYNTANYDIVIDFINDAIQWRLENWE